MRPRVILILSLLANLALGALWLGSRHTPTPIHRPIPEYPSPTNAVHTVVVVRKQFFSWDQLESPDYQAYVNNLRDIGCPEETIRDIIVADVNNLYAWRRLTEVPDPNQEWWLSIPETNLVASASAKRQSLEQERINILTTLLETNWQTATAPLNSFVCLTGPVLGDLSPETKRTVQEILARSNQSRITYQNEQADIGKTMDFTASLALDDQMRGELAQVLNPVQLEEYELRYSSAAASLRIELRAATNITQDEFRKLFQLTEPMQQNIQLALAKPGIADTNVTSAANQFYDALKNVLGPDRYQSYRIATDPIYRAAVQTVAGANARPETLQAVYALTKATLNEQNRILNDPSLSADEKSDQLKSIEQQDQVAENQILGVQPPQPPPLPPLPSIPTEPDTTPAAVHSYSPGETVDQLAQQYGVTSAAILNANPNIDFNNLSRGTQINIPKRQ